MIVAWLPSELLIETFRYLSLTEQCLVAASVCRRYRALCRSLPLCRSFDVQSVITSALLPSWSALWQRRRNQSHGSSLQRAVHDPVYWLSWLLHTCHRYRRDMLRELRVTACDVPWPLLDRVVTLCGQRLTSLDLSHCLAATDAAVLECVAKCPHLRSLTLNFCAALTRDGVAGALKGMSCLHSLSLCGMPQVDDAVILAALTSHHTSLTTLNLRATGVSAAAFAALTDPPSRSLRVLGLSCCLRLTDAAMAHIARLYPFLEDVSVDSCDAITDVGVGALTNGLSGLQRLSVARCRRVTDASVLPMLSRFSSTLRVVCLDDTKVSCAALAAVLRGAAMEEASLVGCKYVKAGLSRTSLRRGIHQAGRVHMFKKATRLYLEI